MSPVHSVKETTRILRDLDPQEKDQLQESVLVTVATTFTNYRSPSTKYFSRTTNELQQGDNNIQTDDSCDADDSSNDESEYTEDEYGDDEEESAEEESTASQKYDSMKGSQIGEKKLETSSTLCPCKECTRERENRKSKSKSKNQKDDESKKGDKRISVHSCQVQTSGAVTEYRPFVLQSPCK